MLQYYLENSFSIWKTLKQLVTCALMKWFLLYTTCWSLELIKKKKRKKYHEVLDTDCTKPIIKFWSWKHGLWFKRTGFHSLSAVKAQTAGIQLLALFSPVDTLAVGAEHWKRLTGTGLRGGRQDRDGVQTVTSPSGSALHRYTANRPNPGSDKCTQFPIIYHRVGQALVRMLVHPTHKSLSC